MAQVIMRIWVTIELELLRSNRLIIAISWFGIQWEIKDKRCEVNQTAYLEVIE
jgi:hypothetical protein